MNEWTVISIIITLVGFVATVVKPIINLTSSITKLTVVVQQLQDNYKTMSSEATNTHDEIYDKLDEHGKAINDHETRLQLLEK